MTVTTDHPCAVEAKRLCKSYGQTSVLKEVSLHIPAGQTTVLIGPSGCGKSTLLRCMNRLEVFQSGELWVQGHNLATHRGSLSQYRSQVGMVFQQFNLFPHLTILDNITLAPRQVRHLSKPDSEERAQAYLKKVGLQDKATVFPHELSGGQQQRVAIARALAMEPSILLLDEPTSALDPLMSQEVLQVLSEVAQQGITLVLVTHEWQFACKVAQQLIVMDDGQVLEAGDPTTVMNNPSHPKAKRFLQCLSGKTAV